nr:MAG: putative RNA-dependent RNA polymerase [Narnaviridae sp.]
MEIDRSSLRHNSFIRSLCFDLESSIRIISHDGTSYPISSGNVYKKASKAKLSMSQKERKKFLSDCRHFGSITEPKALQVLKKLLKSYPKESIIGYQKYGLRFQCFREYTRVKHILGLSDAIDQAMSNFGMTISFPTFKTAKLIDMRFPPKKCRVFAKVQTDPYPQIDFRFMRRSLRTRARRFDLLLHFLRVFPKQLAEKEYVKIIKLSLAGTFSQETGQELPTGFLEKGIPLFPEITKKKLDHVLGGLSRKDKRVQFYFNILQSKSLCSPVGEDMIAEAYSKHERSLCREQEDTIPKDDYLYQKLYEYGKDVGKNLQYDPFSTKFPNSMASIENNRLSGGNRQSLKMSGTLRTFSKHPLLGLSENEVRLEPFVIGLFGTPGCGKTTLVNRIISELRYSLCPEMAREDFVYSRSCSTNHWDGYSNQPVVVLDDFGQNLETRNDISEFMTLISLNDYVLPMAELSEKGKKFNSPIVIVTSNMGYGSQRVTNSCSGDVIEDPLALWRRFDLPLYLDCDKQSCWEYDFDFMTREALTTYEKKHQMKSNGMKTANWPLSGRLGSSAFPFPRIPRERRDVPGLILSGVKSKFDFHRYTFHDSWTQKISSKNISFEKFREGPIWDPVISDVSDESCYPNARRVYLDFPSYPPPHSPIVKAQALPEPLKVRMITVAEADTKVLQPLQMALWRYLFTKPQFCLTNGVKELENFEGETLPWIYRIEQVIRRIQERGEILDEPFWLSGDYTAATDSFPMWVTEALVEGILSEIDHEPTKRWVRWEVSPHEIRYPGDRTGVQTSGQLMGSLLSFPLLCFLNDFVMQESGFDPLSYLINGDDVVARSEMDNINRWRKLSPKVGLELSVGKNFIDRDFCTVNSQLFFRGDVRHTGKVSCQTRVGQTIGYTFQEAQFYWGCTPEIKENFLTRNWTELKKTPRSLHFSTDHGGLGLRDTADGLRLDVSLHKRVYLYDCLYRFSQVHRVEGAPFSFVAIPLLRGEAARKEEGTHPSVRTFEKFQSLIDPAERLVSKGDDLSHFDIRKFTTLLDNIIGKMDVVEEGRFNLSYAPSRKFLEVQYLAVTNGLAQRVKRASLRQAYSYIREEWLEGTLSHPFEYKDHGDMLEDQPDEIWDDYRHENLDIVRMFRDDDDPLVSSDGDLLQEDVLKFWDPIEQLESLDGGTLFVPRPQGFQKLDEFLSCFQDELEPEHEST